MKEHRKGYALMIDALIALIFMLIILSTIYSMSFSRNAKSDIMSFKELHYVSEDVLDVLNKNGVLDNLSTNWAANSSRTSPEMISANMTARAYLEQMLPPGVGYNLTIEEGALSSTIAASNSSRPAFDDSTTSTHSTRVLVGYGSDKPTFGYSARASLKSISTKAGSDYLFFGGFEGQGNLTKFIDIPSDANVTNVYMEMNPGENFDLYVNGQYCNSFTGMGWNLSAKSWTLSEACEDLFSGGRNLLTLNFTSNNDSFIGGGYVRVDYTSDQWTWMPDRNHYWFPGVQGIINVYSGAFFPPNIHTGTFNIYLHYANNALISKDGDGATVYLNIGGKELYRSDKMGEIKLNLTNANMTNAFGPAWTDEFHLGGKTVPIKFGTEPFLVSGMEGTADVVLITDLSGSMNYQMNQDIAGTQRACDDTSLYNYSTKRISLAKCLDKEFIDIIMKVSGNRMGLVGFNNDAYDYTADLGFNQAQLEAEVDTYPNNPAQGTCICCAINRAKSLLEKSVYYGADLIENGTSWAYENDSPLSPPAANWMNLAYVETGWMYGNTSIGFPSAQVRTYVRNNLVNRTTIYAANSSAIFGGRPAGGSLSDTYALGGGTYDMQSNKTQLSNYYVESDAVSTLNSISVPYVKTSLLFTPPQAGDYLVLGTSILGGTPCCTGPCCNPATCAAYTLADNHACGTPAEYQCSGVQCSGSERVQRRTRTQYCNGAETTTCTGALSGWSGWSNYLTCLWYEKCNAPATATCNECSTCRQCNSGDCCDAHCRYQPGGSSVSCYTSAPVYSCAGPNCGDDVMQTVTVRYCTGSSSSCPSGGGISQKTTADSCTPTEKCFGSACVSDPSCSGCIESDLRTNTGVTISSNRFESRYNADYYVFAGHRIVNMGPPQKNISIRYSALTPPAGTQSRIKDARIIAINLSAEHSTTADYRGSTTNYGANWANGPSLSTAGRTPGKYLLIASADVTASSTSYGVNVRLRDSAGNTINDFTRVPTVSGENYTFMAQRVVTLPGSTSYTLQYQRTSSAAITAFMRNARITLVKLDGNYSIAESEAVSSPNGWATKTQLTYTAAPVAGEYLVIASAMIQETSTSAAVEAKLNVDGVDISQMTYYPRSSSDYVTYFTIKKFSWAAASSHPILLRFQRNGGGTANIKQARITVIRLSPSYTGTGMIANFNVSYGGAIKSLKALIVASSNVSTNHRVMIYNFDTLQWETSGCTSMLLGTTSSRFWCNKTSNLDAYVSANKQVRVAFGTVTNTVPSKVSVTSQNQAIRTRMDYIVLNVNTSEGSYFFRKTFNIVNTSKLTGVQVNILSDNRTETYLNGALVDNDMTVHLASKWNRQLNLTTANLVNGTNIIAVRLYNYDTIGAKFDLRLRPMEKRRKFIVVMTDGITGYSCGGCTYTGACSSCGGACAATSGTYSCDGDLGDCNNAACDPAISDAICSARNARTSIDSTVYSIGIGPVVTVGCANALNALQNMASCGGGQFCGSADPTAVKNCYLTFANLIANASMTAQLLNVSGKIKMNNTLYPDSNIYFTYSSAAGLLKYGESLVNLESPQFGNKNGLGNFIVPNRTRAVDVKVTSYSGPYWTNRLKIRSANTGWVWDIAYDLGSYLLPSYETLGDPFIVTVPAEKASNGTNYVNISTGRSSTQDTNASPQDKVLYSVAISTVTSYTLPHASGEGCNWTVEFFDNTIMNISAPYGYSGPNRCSYNHSTYNLKDYDNKSSVNEAAYGLFSQLDVAPRDGKLDVKFSLQDLVVDATTIGNVRSLWGPVRVRLQVWM